jgi:hypothetical protein
MLISQTFRGTGTLDEEGFKLVQKWYMLTNAKKHEIIKEVLADGLCENKPGGEIKKALAYAINKAVDDGEIRKLQY